MDKKGQTGQIEDLRENSLWKQLVDPLHGNDPGSTSWVRNKVLYEECDRTILKKLYTQIIKIEYSLGLNSRYTLLEDYYQTLKVMKSKRKGNLWLYLTINPRRDVSYFDFGPAVFRFVKRKMFTQFFFSFEQRSSTEQNMGEGFHIHLLLKRNIKVPPNKVIRNSKNSFKGFTNVNNSQIFFYRWCPQEYLIDKVAYIKGNKTGEGKDLKHEIDIEWRKIMKLDPFYGEPPQDIA